MGTLNAQGPKVLMIGIDAGDIHFIRSSLGRLPALRRLFSASPACPLESTGELTSSVWPTFSTGKRPGAHGAYYPMQWDPERMTLRRIDAHWLPFEPFWHELARGGKQVTALDVPFSFASRMVSGIEVINWGSQECLGPFHCNRREVGLEILRRFGRHPMGAEVPLEESTERLSALAASLVAGARKKGELTCWLMKTAPWDLFITVFGECHRAGHVLWPGPGARRTPVPPNALADVYQAVDAAISCVLDGVDFETTTVILFSGHGARPNYTQEHLVLPMMERINAAFEGTPADGAAPEKSGNAMQMLRTAVPPQLQQALAKAVPAAARDWVVKRSFCGGLDWRRTLGFALPASGEGYIRFNLAGREARGAVELHSARHRQYRAWLNEALFGFKDARTHTPIVKEVVFPAERYPGPRSRFLPDAVILWNDLPPAQEIYSDRLGRLTGRLATGRTGEHHAEGFVLFAGNMRGLANAPPLKHIDGFAPLVTHLLNGTA